MFGAALHLNLDSRFLHRLIDGFFGALQKGFPFFFLCRNNVFYLIEGFAVDVFEA